MLAFQTASWVCGLHAGQGNVHSFHPHTPRQDNCLLAKSACRESNPVFRWLTGERSKNSRHGASNRLMRWVSSRPLGSADHRIDECVFPEQVDVIRYVPS